MSEWVKYDVERSPVQASLEIARVLKEQDKNLIFMHQGAEESVPKGLEHLRHFDGTMSPLYNNVLPAREEMAGFARHFFGLPAEPKNTFVVQSNGRDVLARAWRMTTHPFIEAKMGPVAGLPRKHWPMYQDVVIDANVEHQIKYDINRGDVLNSIRHEIDAFTGGDQSLQDRIAILATNLPANPTGYASSVEEVKEIQDFLDRINEYRAERGMPKIAHIADDPYFAGLMQKLTGSVLKTPYEGNFKIDSVTPSFIVFSFSKALGTANLGTTGIVVTDSKMAKSFETALKAGNGFSFVKGAMDNFSEMISEKNYPLVREHFGNLRAKYLRNFTHVQNSLGQHLLDGDPNMVCTIRIPDNVLNKSILCNDGQRREITSGRDVVEYIANTYGVMTVDQSLPDEPLLRLALKLENEEQIAKGAHSVDRAYNDLANAPSLNRGFAMSAPDLDL